MSGYENATFTWKLGNTVIGNEQTLGFVSDQAGSYDLTLEIKSASKSIHLKTTVKVQQETTTYSKYIAQVFDYLPSIGQFTNKLPLYEARDTKATMATNAGKALVGDKPSMTKIKMEYQMITNGTKLQEANMQIQKLSKIILLSFRNQP